MTTTDLFEIGVSDLFLPRLHLKANSASLSPRTTLEFAGKATANDLSARDRMGSPDPLGVDGHVVWLSFNHPPPDPYPPKSYIERTVIEKAVIVGLHLDVAAEALTPLLHVAHLLMSCAELKASISVTCNDLLISQASVVEWSLVTSKQATKAEEDAYSALHFKWPHTAVRS